MVDAIGSSDTAWATLFGLPVAFLWTCIVIELTPGPNMSYLAILSLTNGRRVGFYTVAGICLGLTIVGLLAAIGLAEIVSQSRFLFELLRWAGTLYLLWLAYDIWHTPSANDHPGGETAVTAFAGFKRGLITNLLNPKAAIFYIAIVPPFLDPGLPPLPQTVALSLGYVAVATAIHAGIVILADQARPWLMAGRGEETVRRVMAGLVVLIAVWLAWSTRFPS